MSALAIRRRMRRRRRQLAVISAVLVLAALLAVHHSGPLMDTHQHAGMGAVIQLCLGVFTAVGAALVAAIVALVGLLRRPTRPPLLRGASSALDAPLVRARHGPAAISVLCVGRC